MLISGVQHNDSINKQGRFTVVHMENNTITNNKYKNKLRVSVCTHKHTPTSAPPCTYTYTVK